MYMHEHLEKLRYFYEVARLGSMKKASEAVFVTQPSLSKSIKVLEEVVGHELFVRLPRGVRMTEEGEILFNYCHELFASLGDLEARLENTGDPMAGSLRVGTYDSIGIYFWPKFLRDFLPKYPNLSLELTTGRSRLMIDRLEAGELDLILVINPRKVSSIVVDIIGEDSFKFYRTTRKKAVFSELASAPLILMPDSFAPGDNIKDKLSGFNLEERKIYTTSSLESSKELAINGLGLGFLPQRVAEDAVQQGKLTEVDLGKGSGKAGLFPHTLGLAYPKNKKGNPLFMQVIQEIKEKI